MEKVGLWEQDPKEQLKEWTKSIRSEQRALDRQIRGIEREENRYKKDIEMLAKKNEMMAIRPLATALVQSKKAKERIHVAKANMNSIILQLRHQTAQLRINGVLESSTSMMKSMNQLMNMSTISKNMGSLAYEMEKAGLIEEILEDTLDTEALDDAVDEEVDKVIAELTMGVMKSVPAAPSGAVRQQLAESGRTLFQQSISDGQTMVPG